MQAYPGPTQSPRGNLNITSTLKPQVNSSFRLKENSIFTNDDNSIFNWLSSIINFNLISNI